MTFQIRSGISFFNKTRALKGIIILFYSMEVEENRKLTFLVEWLNEIFTSKRKH